jgi:hypothetical protein
MKLLFLPAAREELEAAVSYLDNRALRLGGELLDDVERTAAFVCAFPRIGRSIDPTHNPTPTLFI